MAPPPSALPSSSAGPGASSPGLRDRVREAMRAEVVAVAFRLFAEEGFDHVTVDQIAAAAGVSRTTFFRYFGTKEDVVLSRLEGLGQQLAAAMAARPAGEDAWESLRATFGVVTTASGHPAGQALPLMRMMQDTPSLRARHGEKQRAWQDLLVPELARRLGGGTTADLRARALAGAALACLDAATEAWTACDGTVSLAVLVDRAMGVLASG